MRLREFVTLMGLDQIVKHVLVNSTELLPYDPEGWDTDPQVLPDLIRELRPSSIIELGSWKGGSALSMAMTLTAPTAPVPTILCVDTWLGSVEHVNGNFAHYSDIRPRGPSLPLLHQFLCNLIHFNLQTQVFPFPATTSTAIVLLRHHQVVVDMIYVDASHDYADVVHDLSHYWGRVRPGGILVGDDYSDEFPGVVNAVKTCSILYGVEPELQGRKYIFRKPADRILTVETAEMALHDC